MDDLPVISQNNYILLYFMLKIARRTGAAFLEDSLLAHLVWAMEWINSSGIVNSVRPCLKPQNVIKIPGFFTFQKLYNFHELKSNMERNCRTKKIFC